MYRRPKLYDAIYSFKDYAKEADMLRQIISSKKKSAGNTLLDIACGTGKHIEHLKHHFQCEGLDNSPELLKAARERNPECEFHDGDMIFFDLGRWFDVVACLFSAIGYVRTFEALKSTLMRFSMHTAPGGLVVVEPWLFPDKFIEGHLGMNTVDEPYYKVARMNTSHRVGDISVLEFHYMCGSPDGIEVWSDRSELGLFSLAEYTVAFEEAGLEVEFQPEGFDNRGLFIGMKAG